jgi:predicted nucleotidyltransferase component of viral defense system
MDEMEPVWHRETVDARVERTLRDLHNVPILKSFYLAGGTGLALRLGHRLSADLDFFVGEDFNEDYVLQKLQHLDGFATIAKEPGTIYANICKTKVSFIAYAYPILFPFQLFLGVNVADSRDIGCMKISAIASRGTKRDFIDLYRLAQEYDLKQLLGWFKTKFSQTNYSIPHILKSLSYFEEAEQDPMPHMLIPLSWEDVKQFFAREAPRLIFGFKSVPISYRGRFFF